MMTTRSEGRGRGRQGRRRGGPPPTNLYQFKVICFDRSTGQKQWQTIVIEQVPHETGRNTDTYASSSPTTDGKHIFANFGSHGVFCLDMAGNIQWSKQLGRMQTVATFGEGASATLAGEKLIVPWDHEGASFLIALSTDDGEERWRTARDDV